MKTIVEKKVTDIIVFAIVVDIIMMLYEKTK